jgi:hypothetical protein
MSIEHGETEPTAEPMTRAQASYLRTLTAEAGDTFDSGLSRAAAAKRIEELERKTRRGPPRADAGDGGASIRANETPAETDGPPWETE